MMKPRQRRDAILTGMCVGLVFAWLLFGRGTHAAAQSSSGNTDWAVYGGGPENTHYSALAQINRSNVKDLAVAWSFDTGESGGLQTSPLIVDGTLYGITPTQKIFALDAANGRLLWKFDAGIKGTQPDRGLAYWSNGKERRILVGVMNFLTRSTRSRERRSKRLGRMEG